MQPRPIDRATVRIMALMGVDGEEGRGNRTGRPRMLAIPQVSHGSGLAITADGLILTARHVVADADVLAVLLPGQERALAATVVASDPDHDVAFVRVRGPLHDFLPLPAAPVPVQALQRVSASGYPLEARERTPAATSGEVSRVNDDGRIQLAIGLNPGNSGGPVIDAQGRLLGVVSQGADPAQGAQGVALIEPLRVVLDAYRRLPATTQPEGDAAAQAAEQEVAQLVADIVRAGPWGLVYDDGVNERLSQLSERDTRPQVRVLIAAHLWNLLMLLVESREQADFDGLQGDDARTSANLMALMIQLCRQAQAQDANIRRRYPFVNNVLSAVEMLERHTCGANGQACCHGGRCGPYLACGTDNVCAPPTRCTSDASCPNDGMCTPYGACVAQPTYNYFFHLRPTLTIARTEQGVIPGGGVGLGLSLNLGTFGPAALRMSPVLGMETFLGSWKENMTGTFSGLAGLAVSVGGRYRAVLRGLYQPTFYFGTQDGGVAPVGYRIDAMVRFPQAPSFHLGVTWSATSLPEQGTLRMLGLALEFGF